MHRVRPCERAGGVCELGDAGRVDERAGCIRREREGDDARAVAELSLEVVEVQRRVVVHLDELHGEPEVVCELEPRRHVRVVVELRAQDLVAWCERAPDGPRKREVESRHVRAEDRLVGAAAEECRRRQARLRDERVAAPAVAERAAEVRVRLPEVAGDRVDHRVGALRSAGGVEEGSRRAERREAGASGVDVERGGGHGRTLPCRP